MGFCSLLEVRKIPRCLKVGADFLKKLMLGASPSNCSTLFCREPESLSLLLDYFSVHFLLPSVPHRSPISSKRELLPERIKSNLYKSWRKPLAAQKADNLAECKGIETAGDRRNRSISLSLGWERRAFLDKPKWFRSNWNSSLEITLNFITVVPISFPYY